MSQHSSLNIIHLVRAPIGGIFRHLADLATAQAGQGHQVGIICDSLTGGPFEDDYVERLRAILPLGVTRLEMPRAVGLADIAAMRRVSKALKMHNLDVLHCHGSKGGVYGRLAKCLGQLNRKTAVFYAPHGGSLHYPPKSKEGRIYFAIERFLERWTSGIAHVSEYEQRTYVQKVGLPKTKAHVIHNGIGEQELTPIEPNADAKDFLFIGMLRDLKGVDLFINAMRTLNDQAPATAWIVGDGAEEDKARYRQMVTDFGLSDVVQFYPATPAREVFSMAKSIVVPSRAESLPYIVLEAAGAKLPMICTNVGGISEIYGEQSNVLVTPTLDAITEAMQDMKAATFQAPTTAYLHENVSANFSIKVMEERVMKLYQEALAR